MKKYYYVTRKNIPQVINDRIKADYNGGILLFDNKKAAHSFAFEQMGFELYAVCEIKEKYLDKNLLEKQNDSNQWLLKQEYILSKYINSFDMYEIKKRWKAKKMTGWIISLQEEDIDSEVFGIMEEWGICPDDEIVNKLSALYKRDDATASEMRRMLEKGKSNVEEAKTLLCKERIPDDKIERIKYLKWRRPKLFKEVEEILGKNELLVEFLTRVTKQQ